MTTPSRYNAGMTTPTTVLCAGCVVVDEVFRVPRLPRGDGKFFASERRRCMGGMAAGAAATVAALGGRASLWAALGDDRDGDFLHDEIRRLGINPILVRRRKTASAFSAVCADDSGRRMIVNRAPPELFAAPKRAPSLRETGAVVADIRWPAAAELALNAARKANLPAVLDWETTPKLQSAQSAKLKKLARAATHVVFSTDGLKQFVPGESRFQNALRKAANICGAKVAVTRGERGVAFLRENNSVGIVPAPKVKTDNTLGAGDAFHGALALALMLTEHNDADADIEFETCLVFAAATAAAKCAKPAGEFPNRREVFAVLRQMYPELKPR